MNIKKFLILILILFVSQNSFAEVNPHYIDFKLILNKSDAGNKAQKFLQNRLESGFKNIREKEKKIQDEEKKIIQQKKVISPEEYKKKVSELRTKVASLQKERNNLLEKVSKQRAKAKKTLLENLNPIVKEYMEKNQIRMVIDKKNLLLADEKLDITQPIMKLLNQKLKSINLK